MRILDVLAVIVSLNKCYDFSVCLLLRTQTDFTRSSHGSGLYAEGWCLRQWAVSAYIYLNSTA